MDYVPVSIAQAINAAWEECHPASEPVASSATVIAALESDREALRRVAEGLAVRVAKLEATVVALDAALTPEGPPNPLVRAMAAHPWLQDPKANWRMGA